MAVRRSSGLMFLIAFPLLIVPFALSITIRAAQRDVEFQDQRTIGTV